MSERSLAEIISELADIRPRSSWNDRLAHWEKPASDTEEAQIERAASMVRETLAGHPLLTRDGVEIQAQGSYHNNTNVRLESDIDLRAVHPLIRVEYGEGVSTNNADAALGLVGGRALRDVNREMRSAIAEAFEDAFGKGEYDASGNKAIRLKKRQGTRADLDIVPCFRYLWVCASGSQYVSTEGISILGSDGSWTNNFPAQHYANGVAKRANTGCRFKKIVRMTKRLRDELAELGRLGRITIPSYFIESLIYCVEDVYFLVESDDRYDRLRRVLRRAAQLLADDRWCTTATEINGIKYLFHPTRGWTLDGARIFIARALERLEA